MDRCAHGSVRLALPGYLRVALLWLLQLEALAQHGRSHVKLYGSNYGEDEPESCPNCFQVESSCWFLRSDSKEKKLLLILVT